MIIWYFFYHFSAGEIMYLGLILFYFRRGGVDVDYCSILMRFLDLLLYEGLHERGYIWFNVYRGRFVFYWFSFVLICHYFRYIVYYFFRFKLDMYLL